MLKADAVKWLEQLVNEYPEDEPQALFDQLAANVQQHGGAYRFLISAKRFR